MLFLKWLVGFVVVVLAVGAGTYGFMASDRGPTNAVLGDADLPGLIPFRNFFADTGATWTYRLSDDGSWKAWHAATFGGVNVKVSANRDNAPVTTIKTGHLQDLYWDKATDRVVVQRDWRLWAIDPEKPGEEDWEDITPRGFNNWWLVRIARDIDDRTIIMSNDREVEAADLYSVAPDGSGKRLLAENPGNVTFWTTDEDGIPVVRALSPDDDGRISFERLLPGGDPNDQTQWVRAFSRDANDTFNPVHIPAGGETYFALSNTGRDTTALVKVDGASGAEEVVTDGGESDIVFAVTFFRGSEKPDLVLRTFGDPFYEAVSPLGAKVIEALESLGPVHDVQLTSIAQKARAITFEVSYGGGYFTDVEVRPDTGEIKVLGKRRFSQFNDRLAAARHVWFEARDGMRLGGVLTVPKTRNGHGGPFPAIVRVHGGPAQFEATGYEGTDQFLANRCYAVLHVNFRGSTGYGKAYQAAGFGEIGKAMQDDVADAARWLIDEGIADPEAIAVMGGSYGGLSAALAMTRDPGLFRAAVVDSAVLDIPYQMDNNPFAWRLRPDLAQRYFGDRDNTEDRAQMAAISPVNLADKVHGPILLAHGKQDRVVGFEQAEAFARVLDEAGKPHELLLFEKEGHQFERWQSKVVYWRRVEQFLAEHLGGRDGGFDYVEMGPKIFGK